MASPSRRDGVQCTHEPESPRIVAGKPFEVVDGCLVKTGPEQWELDGRDGPTLDDHILDVDQPWQLVDGELIEMAPAREPHGVEHADLAYVLCAHIAVGHEAFVDVLTRFDEGNDFAPDASVRPLRDPVTSQPTLETLAFEICGEQSLSVNTRKARVMVARGVRQVFCLDLRRERVLAWDRAADDWRELQAEELIVDASLAHPLPVAALLDASLRDDTVVEALRARHVPALERVRAEGLAIALIDLIETRELTLDPTLRARIEGCVDLEMLRQWHRRAVTATVVGDIFGD